MQTPPIQSTMQMHEAGAGPRLLMRRLLGAVILALLFFAAAWTAFAYMTLATGPSPAQLAAAAETAAIREAFSDVVITGKAAIVADLGTGRVVYAKNPDAQLPLASLTKVALALVVSEVLPPESAVEITRDVPPTSSTGAIPAHSHFAARDLIGWMLTGSSNEIAELLAAAAAEPLRAKYAHLSGENPALDRMNEFAAMLGLRATYFGNVSGLDQSATLSGAYGSARDMAILFAYAASASLPVFTATAQETVSITSLEGMEIIAKNTDDAVHAIPGLLMGKTGFTDLAGGNLAVVFKVRDRNFVAVVLGSTQADRFSDVETLAHTAKSAAP